MKTSSRLPNGFWTANGTYTNRLLALYIVCFRYEPNPSGGNFLPQTVQEAIKYLRSRDIKTWGMKSLDEMAISSAQQTAWGLTNQPSVVSGQVSVYMINKDACKKARKISGMI